MARHTFVTSTLVETSAENLFDWHEAKGAFERLTPPSEPVTVLRHVGGIRDGAQVSLKVGPWPFSLRWDLEHRDYQKGRSFTDQQVKGPFRYWKHVHSILPQSEHQCLLEDRIEYELPFGWLGSLVGNPIMRHKLKTLFAFRHEVTRRAFTSPR